MQTPDAIVTLEKDGKKLQMTPAEVSAEILKALVKETNGYYGDIKDVVITVPAKFNEIGRSNTRKAAELAGLNLLGIISEPTAASMCYELTPEDNGSREILVYDLGGGTFDISLVQITGAQDYSEVDDLYEIPQELRKERTETTINKYEIEGEQHVSPQKPSHSGGNHSNNGTGNTTSLSGTTESATTENTTEGTTDAPDTISVAIKVNGESLDESLEWEDDNLTSIHIAGLHNVKISCYAAGKELTGDSEIEANDNIEAIKISADEDLSYAVKTKQFGWLDFTKDEYAGSLGTDDYLVGIKFKFDSVEDDDCTALVGKVDTTNCKYSKLTFKLFTDKWSDKLPNGAISDNKDGINAIRISADGITYSVRTDKWLPEVSSGVLAGDIYGDNYVTGLKISGQDIMFRVKTADGLWSDWYSSGDSVVNENQYRVHRFNPMLFLARMCNPN